jgi:hypothetical protein
MNTFDLINNLYTSIVNYETIHKLDTQYIQHDQNNENEDEHYFIDRQYRREGGEYNNRSREGYGRDEYEEYRGGKYERDERDENSFRGDNLSRFSRLKKCFDAKKKAVDSVIIRNRKETISKSVLSSNIRHTTTTA